MVDRQLKWMQVRGSREEGGGGHGGAGEGGSGAHYRPFEQAAQVDAYKWSGEMTGKRGFSGNRGFSGRMRGKGPGEEAGQGPVAAGLLGQTGGVGDGWVREVERRGWGLVVGGISGVGPGCLGNSSG